MCPQSNLGGWVGRGAHWVQKAEFWTFVTYTHRMVKKEDIDLKLFENPLQGLLISCTIIYDDDDDKC